MKKTCIATTKKGKKTFYLHRCAKCGHTHFSTNIYNTGTHCNQCKHKNTMRPVYKTQGHSLSNMKYKIIKRMKNRAITFMKASITPDEKNAWEKVITWFNSFLDPQYRTSTRNGAIGLNIKNEDIDKVWRERNQKKEKIKE